MGVLTILAALAVFVGGVQTALTTSDNRHFTASNTQAPSVVTHIAQPSGLQPSKDGPRP